MELNTDVCRSSLSFLSSIKDNEIQEGMFSLVSKEGVLYGRVVDKQGKFHMSAILSHDVQDEIKSVIPLKIFDMALSGYKGDSFSFNLKKKEVNIVAGVSVSFPVYDSSRVHTFADDFSNFGEPSKIVKDFFSSEVIKNIKDMLSFTCEEFPYVYIKEGMAATNQTCVRFHRSNKVLPYTVHMSPFLFKVVLEMNNPSISFYENLFILDDSNKMIIVARDVNAETMYDVYLKNTSVLSVSTSFSFNASSMRDAFSRIRPFLNKTGNNKVKLNIAKGEVSYVEGEQRVVAPVEFKSSDNFTYKYVKFTDFYPLIKEDKDITVLSGEPPFSEDMENTEPFLSWDSGEEVVMLAPFVEKDDDPN